MDWNKFSGLVSKTIRTLEKKNISHAEAFFTYTKGIEVTIRNSEVLTQNRVDDSGVGFRVATNGNKVGFACTNIMSEKAILEAGKKALSISKISSAIPNFTLPQESKPTRVKGLFDPEVEAKSVDDIANLANRAISAAEDFDKRVIAKDGRFLYESMWRGIINASGVNLDEHETSIMAYLGCSGKEGKEVTSSCYDVLLKKTGDVDPEELGKNVGKKVLALLNPKPLKSFQGSVIFTPEAISYQIFEVMKEALKGDEALAKSSAWTDKINQSVASESLSVTDDPLLEGGFASRSFDDEGCSSCTTSLISKGELLGFLHDSTSANALNTRNTGNATRFSGGFDMIRSIIGQGYRTRPQIYPSNLIVKPGSKTREELISEVREGVLVESMAGFPQAGSGVISVQLSQAFFVQEGEIVSPIKNGMVSGVAFDWLKKISEVCNDSKQFSNIITPSIHIEDVKVIGA
jgi:PmbA protein